MFELFRNIFKARPKKFLGIDIGTSFIRIVEIGRNGQNRRLENYGEIGESSFGEQPFRTSKKSTLSLSDKNIAEAIRAVLKEAGIQTKEVNFSIPDFYSFFTSFKLPIMSKEEIPEAVRYQVRPFVPLPLEEIALDWSIIEGQPSKTPLKVLVVAIPMEVVSQYQEIARLAGLELKILESEVFALTRALVKNEKTKKVVSLIDIGARSTTCSILEEGILKTSYSFNIAGNQLTEVVAKSLDVKYNEAEDLKKQQGLIVKDSRLKKFVGGKQSRNLSEEDIPKILIPLTDSILEEIKKVFRDFYRIEGKEVDKIILSGGTVLTPGLEKYFVDELKKEVINADPFLHIVCPPILTATLKKMGPLYGIAVGLALKGFE